MPANVKVKKTGGTAYSGEDQSRYEETPEGYQALWDREFETSDKELDVWRKQAAEVEKIYSDDRKSTDTNEKRMNMFTADTVNAEALLYGRVPQTDVSRKYQDSGDEVGRVAAMAMQRVLNGDIERPNDRFAACCGHALSDHLRTNFGLLRFRYDFKTKKVKGSPAVSKQTADGQVVNIPAVEDHEEVVWEDVISEYCHWRDVKWSPCKVWEEARWIAFRVQMTRRELKARFKEGARVTLDAKKTDMDDDDSADGGPRSPWDRADVWEIWSKEHGKVFWYVKGWKRILDVQDDPLELEDFWPCPKPIVAWITTTRFRPKPEYLIAQDSYRAIDHLTTRIDLLVSALRVLGIYDDGMQELQDLLDSTEENRMVPVANWASVASEKGGLEGAVSWFPLDQVVAVLEQLRQQRQSEIDLNHEITGHADIMRGTLENPGETATASRAKVKFASKRIQRKQDMFSEFVSRAQCIRAEIICKRFSAETIRARSNIEYTEDAQLADEAIALLKEEGIESFRITVKSEALALPDYAEMKQDRTEFMTAMSGVIASLVKLPPVAMPILPELAVALKWYASGFRGAVEIESAMDRMAKKLEKVSQQPPPAGDQGDQTKVEAQKLKNEGDQQRIQMEAQNRSQEIAQESQAKKDEIALQAEFDMKQEQQRQMMEQQRESREHALEQQKEAISHAHEEHMVGQQAQLEAQTHEREESQQERAHEQQLEMEAQKAKTATNQLRIKGQQMVKAAKLKPKPKSGGKK